MYVALVGDTQCLDDGLAQFKALVVGLLDERVRVAQVVSEQVAKTEAGPFGETFAFRDSDWSLWRRYQISRMASQLAELEVSVVHALGGRVWSGSLGLARRLGVPLVATASMADDVGASAKLMRRSGAVRVAFTPTTAPLAEAVAKLLGPRTLVQVIPPGVHIPSEPPTGPKDREALCVVITGNGKLDADYQAVLSALPMVVEKYPDAQFFFNSQRQDQHQLWQAARKLGLLSNVSLVPRRPGHHELLLRADVLIQPQALGQSSGLTIQAMAQGLPVVARRDDWLDYLLPDETARVVDVSEPAAWAQHMLDVIEKPEAAAALGQSAREWVGRKHVAARQVALTLAMYRQVTGEAFKFSKDT